VLAESFERIHRANLIGMGVLPLQYLDGQDAGTLGLSGHETFTTEGLAGLDETGRPDEVVVRADSGPAVRTFRVRVRLDTAREATYLRHGGILPYVARSLSHSATRDRPGA
jgi:aconitate hydratase